MKINKELADGIVISGKDFEYIRAVRKPSADVKIIREFWFKGKAKDFQKTKIDIQKTKKIGEGI